MGHHVVVPAPPLDALVSRLWDWDMPPAAHHFERVLPVPGAALIINLHENETRVYSDDAERRCSRAAASVIGGPCLSSQIIDTAEQVRVIGVVFHPGGAHAFTGEDHEALANRDIGLEDIFAMVLRPNYALPNQPTHDRKAARVKAIWPELTIIPWAENRT